MEVFTCADVLRVVAQYSQPKDLAMLEQVALSVRHTFVNGQVWKSKAGPRRARHIKGWKRECMQQRLLSECFHPFPTGAYRTATEAWIVSQAMTDIQSIMLARDYWTRLTRLRPPSKPTPPAHLPHKRLNALHDIPINVLGRHASNGRFKPHPPVPPPTFPSFGHMQRVI
ncbi:hypothetical protein DIPPA_07525 [Diplonema papillatum]|nr:hypothetical protein DIPPA_07525 [Diplonema papillatum]